MIVKFTQAGTQGAAYWKKERFVIAVATTNKLELYSGLSENALAIYSPADGYVIVDVSDYVRAFPANTYIMLTDGSNEYRVNYSIAGLIDPRNVIAPTICDDPICLVSAPSVMLAPINANEETRSLKFEMCPNMGEGYAFATGRVKLFPSGTVYNYGDTINVPNNTDYLEFWHLEDFVYRVTKIKPLDEEVKYTAVKWESFTGVTRLHTFEIVKLKSEQSNTFVLKKPDNVLNKTTGRVDSLTLKLRDLDPYDFWYYSDIITSSSVQVFVNYQWVPVEVTTKDVTTPDGTKSRDLEIVVKYKEYDAVSM